jgi:hypothetical protein
MIISAWISTRTTKKFFAAAACAFIFLVLAALVPSGARARMAVVILEVEGIFEALDETVTPNEIVLRVEGGDASGPLASGCRFLDERGRDMERRVFERIYLHKPVVVELMEHSGEVISCRPVF